MPRPLTRRQTIDNRAYVAALAVSGNLRLAARVTGLCVSTMAARRRVHPEFDRACAAAILFARAAIEEARAGKRPLPPAPAQESAAPHRTRGGEMAVMRINGNQLQLRRAHPGKLAAGTIQAFLAALSATCNVRLSAAAAGASVQSFYRRKLRDPGFAREWRLALERGYEALETALLAEAQPDAFRDDAWRRNDPPAMPPMTVAQALHLMFLHQKEARLIADPPHIKRRRGESADAHSARLAAIYRAGQARAREAGLIAAAERRARGEPGWPGETVALPDLAQVHGWSTARAGAAEWTPGAGPGPGWARLEERNRRRR